MSSCRSQACKIELKGISKRFRVNGVPLKALHDVNLRAEAGEFVSLIGPSGCGKSTLFNIVCGLLEPDEGQVLMDGQPLPQRRGAVGYMHQKDLLLPWRRVLDNVILGPELRGQNLDASRREARELLPLFGLEGFANAFPAVLSGGMKQRAALLRTLLTHRDVLLLDEPFGALDALTRMELQKWLLGVWARFRKTILFITHDVDEAIFLSDRVYVMTPRPGHVKLAQPIHLPRPRDHAIKASPEFAVLRHKLLGALTGDG
jgi:ABC-type nitrate/sulfonate/bicarbonate transport system ATPase subunit